MTRIRGAGRPAIASAGSSAAAAAAQQQQQLWVRTHGLLASNSVISP